jgi:hypothetical protein
MKTKIEMTPAAITRRLRQVEELTRLCLSLAESSAGREVRARCRSNEQVQRISRAIGR